MLVIKKINRDHKKRSRRCQFCECMGPSVGVFFDYRACFPTRNGLCRWTVSLRLKLVQPQIKTVSLADASSIYWRDLAVCLKSRPVARVWAASQPLSVKATRLCNWHSSASVCPRKLQSNFPCLLSTVKLIIIDSSITVPLSPSSRNDYE